MEWGVARGAGYHVFLYNSDEDGELEGSILHALWGRVDGVNLTPADESSAAHARMSEMKIPGHDRRDRAAGSTNGPPGGIMVGLTPWGSTTEGRDR